MDQSRVERYKVKIVYIFECLEEIKGALPNPVGIMLKGVYFDLSSAIESAMDMAAMICKDAGIMPKGDYENLRSIAKREIIDQQLAENLARCNGLRRIIVHQYNGIDDSQVIESIPKADESLRDFIRAVEAYIGES